jgi:uncharacterized protein YggE
VKPLLAVLAAFLSLSVPLHAQEASDRPTLTASGEGTVLAVPDIAIVTLGVLSEAKTAGEALAANNADMTKVIDAVKAAGVAENDIGTSDFSVSPVYQQQPVRADGSEAPPVIVGYRVSNTVRVVIRDFAKSGEILDKVVSAGANQVNSINFDLSDRVTPADQALREAITAATRKATLMADAAGVRLVRVVSVTTFDSGPIPMARGEMAYAMKVAVPVMAGQSSVTANATIAWEIAPK